MARPLIKINWSEFDKLCNLHCTLVEISEWFDCSEDTIERAVKREKGMGFAEYFKRKSGRGKISLRRKMFDLAQGGNVTMCIWLSKNLLGYRDRYEEIIVTPPKEEKKVTFSEFCDNAGYPQPYPKQIEMMEFGLNSEGPCLILGSRGYGKTDYITILGTAYKIYLDPTETFLIITKSEQRNAAMLEEISKALKANGIQIEKENSECVRVVGLTGKDHSVSAVTIGTTSLRGRHPKRAVMDDPVTDEDVSEATRKKAQRVYNEVNKLCPNILIIGQPVHKYDLYQTLRPILNKMEVPHGSISQLDHNLEAQRSAGVDEQSIQASYFLNVKDSSPTPFDKIQFMDGFPSGGSAFCFIDPSDGGNDTAISIIKMFGTGIAVVGFSWKRPWHSCVDEWEVLFKKYGVSKICFETNKHGEHPIIHLRNVLKVGVMGRHSNGNKHSRIMAAGTVAHRIQLSKESHKNYIDQVVRYELGATLDDAPDSLATGLEVLKLTKGKE